MKATAECRECLQRLTYQAAELATDNNQLKTRALKEGLKIIDDRFSLEVVSIAIATGIHDVIKKITGNPDPYRLMKEKEIAVARELVRDAEQYYGNDLKGLLKLAALGNAIDYFRPLDVVKNDLSQKLEFVINDSDKFEVRLKHLTKMLYLADNAGEVFFDIPLINYLRRFTHVIYVVKEAPVQNDSTPGDVKRAGVEDEVGEMMTTGTATPGIDFNLASEEFKREFATAELIFAKGMGYYETLSELPAEGRVFYCLKAKCQPVATSLDVPLNSYVAMLR